MKPADVHVRNHIKVHKNQGSPLLLAHGFGCDQWIWAPMINYLPANIAPITFDFVGCGRSDFSAYSVDSHASIDGYVNELIEVIEALDIVNIDFVGHSIGGMIGMLAAIKRPELFGKIIAIGPSPRYIDDDHYYGGFSHQDITELLSMMERNHFEWAGYLAPLVMKNSHRPDLAEQLRKSFANSDPAISRRFAEVVFFGDHRALLEDIPLPVSILYCDEDVIVPVEVIHYMAEHIPKATTRRLDAVGHYPHVSAPEPVCQAVLASL